MANVPVDLEHRLHRYVVDYVIMSLIIDHMVYYSNDIVDVSNRHGNNTLDIKTTKPGHVMLKVVMVT